jgi:carbonic anhydrase
MWIGCSDSRVPANQITGLEPGEVFVHRNVANVVVHSDLNALSAIQFAVEMLKVEHIMVVGHYGCGGVLAALHGARIGLADNWIRHIQDVRDRHRGILDNIAPEKRADALVDLNVIEQVVNVCVSTVMVDAWAKNQKVTIHGWAFGVHDGLLQDLGMTVSSTETIEPRLPRRRRRVVAEAQLAGRHVPAAPGLAARLRHRQAMLDGFNRHYRLFRTESARAKQRFETADWHGQQRAQRERIEFYDLRVKEAVQRLEKEFKAGEQPMEVWHQVKLHYIGLLIDHHQPELAETFFNSVTTKILHRTYFHNDFIFVRPAVSTEYIENDEPAATPTYRSYYPTRETLHANIVRIVDNFQLQRRSRTWSATPATCSRP